MNFIKYKTEKGGLNKSAVLLKTIYLCVYKATVNPRDRF